MCPPENACGLSKMKPKSLLRWWVGLFKMVVLLSGLCQDPFLTSDLHEYKIIGVMLSCCLWFVPTALENAVPTC